MDMAATRGRTRQMMGIGLSLAGCPQTNFGPNGGGVFVEELFKPVYVLLGVPVVGFIFAVGENDNAYIAVFG